jgi:hypothetical protein
MPATEPFNAKRKLRWYQFSLRTLLIVVTLFAVACSWFAVKTEQARKQRLAVKEIEQQGGYVVYGDTTAKICSPPQQMVLHPDGRVIRERIPASCVRTWLSEWFGYDFAYYVIWVTVKNSDALNFVRDLDYCTDLTLEGIVVDRAVSESLQKMTQLRTISLNKCQCDDGAVANLRENMPQCKVSIATVEWP